MMANEWQVRLGDKVHGPFSDAQLRQLLASGRINADTPVRQEGRSIWMTAAAVIGSLPLEASDEKLSADIEAMLDDVLGLPVVSNLEPLKEPDLPVGWPREAPPKPVAVVPSPPTPAPVLPAISLPADKPEAIPEYFGLEFFSTVSIFVGILLIFCLGVIGIQMITGGSSEQGLPSALGIPLMIVAAIHSSFFFSFGLLLSGFRDGLRELKRISVSNDRIAARLKKTANTGS
jgi:hypothetical protein